MSWKCGWLALPAVLTLVLSAAIVRPSGTDAQTPGSLDDEAMLSLVLPPQADGLRPGVHLWARADQASGPGGLPTVFVVTLYTRQGATGPEEREVLNYLQYTSGTWVPARPRDDGTLLLDDWAWLSTNLKNLTAAATGQNDGSQYIVDYTASGSYGGTPRELSIEEVYGADLSLVTSSVLGDSGANPAPSTATPNAPARAATSTVVPRSTATAAATSTATTSPASVSPTPAVATPTRIVPSGSSAGANIIHPGVPTP
jgi:hypothetical protein